MVKRIVLTLLLALLMLQTAYSQFYDVSRHTIDVSVDEEGYASITEKFFLAFPNEAELQLFKDKSEDIGVSLESWKAFDSRIHTYLGTENTIFKSEVAFIENNEKYLEIKYTLSQPIMYKLLETSRMIEFDIKPVFFNQFRSESLWIIPENTTISISLPANVEIEEFVKPEAAVFERTVTWNGYKSSNILSLKYRYWKQIASFDLQQLFMQLMEGESLMALVGVLAVIAAIVYIKREALGKRIENYLVEHSELMPEEED